MNQLRSNSFQAFILGLPDAKNHGNQILHLNTKYEAVKGSREKITGQILFCLMNMNLLIMNESVVP